jgi:hypothetical protein
MIPWFVAGSEFAPKLPCVANGWRVMKTKQAKAIGPGLFPCFPTKFGTRH